MKTKHLLLATLVIILGTACKKNDSPAPEPPIVTTGLYILSEGTFGEENTTLTYYSFATNAATTDFYQNVNNQHLGKTGNDLLLHGSKMYIVLNETSKVQVVNASTAKDIKEIPFKTSGDVSRLPRYAVGYKNKVLVSSWDGTVAVIDTSSLSVEKWIEVGANPEGLIVVGDKLYVANSGGITPGFDSTLSIINLATMTETQKIRVGINPGAITADDNGNVYVACGGDYGDVKPSLVKVNTNSNTVTFAADTAVGKLKYHDGVLFTTGGYSGSAHVRRLNTTNFATTGNFVTDGTTITNPYGIGFDTLSGDVYITDAKNYTTAGEVFCFDKNGKKKFSFSVSPGINPSSIAFIQQ